MIDDALDARFEAYLARDDDALTGKQFFEVMAEIERRRSQETIEPTLLASPRVTALREAEAKS